MSVSPIVLTAETQELLLAVRDTLAEHFATQLAMSTLPVADMLEVQANQTQDKDRRDVMRAASSSLASLADTLLNGLATSVRLQFDRKLKPDPFRSLGTMTLDTLELVDEAQMQEEIAIGKASMRLKEQVNFEFFSLTRRIGHLLGIDHFVDRDNPVFPGIFAHALLDALRQSGCLPGQRMVMFEAFSPIMIESLPGTYQLANDYLIRRGVLIEIKENYGHAILSKSAEVPITPGPAAASTSDPRPGSGSASSQRPSAPPASGDGELVSLLQQVLQRDETGADERTGVLQRVLNSVDSPALAETELSNLGMLRGTLQAQMLAALQAQARFFPAAPAAGKAREAPAQEALGIDARDVTSPDLPALDTAIPENLNLAQLVTSSIIIGAFSRLLASPPIRQHVGALLLQLQSATIKAAISQPELLTDASHPVRKALDRLTEFAVAQPELLHPGTSSYATLTSIIEALAQQPEYDADAFASVADKIDMLFAYHEEAAAENDPKACMLLEIEIVESAINTATQAIEARLNYRVTDPEFICTFARVVWKEVLFSDMLNGGPSGDLWRRDVETLDTLLTTVRPQETPAARAQLLRHLPVLQGRLDEGAQSVKSDPEYFDAFMTQLRTAQSESLSAPLRRPGLPERPAIQAPEPAALAATAQVKINGHFSAMPHLVPGRWIEFIDEASGRHRRARLNWISPIGAVCLFKDYLDNESFTVELKDLNEQLEQQRARMVESLGISRHAIEFAIRNLGIASPS